MEKPQSISEAIAAYEQEKTECQQRNPTGWYIELLNNFSLQMPVGKPDPGAIGHYRNILPEERWDLRLFENNPDSEFYSDRKRCQTPREFWAVIDRHIDELGIREQIYELQEKVKIRGKEGDDAFEKLYVLIEPLIPRLLEEGYNLWPDLLS